MPESEYRRTETAAPRHLHHHHHHYDGGEEDNWGGSQHRHRQRREENGNEEMSNGRSGDQGLTRRPVPGLEVSFISLLPDDECVCVCS